MASVNLVKDFGVVYGDDSANESNNNAALAAAISWLQKQSVKPKLTADEGIIRYSQSPNFFIPGLVFETNGEVRFRYGGTGNAIVIDGGTLTTAAGFKFGAGSGVIVEAPPTAKHGIYMRNVIRGGINVRCYGAGSQYAGLRLEGCVSTDVWVTVTNTEGGWYMGAQPLAGISMDSSGGANTQTSYVQLHNPVVNSCQVGIFFGGTLGVDVWGGDSEWNTVVGALFDKTALNNRLFGIDLEVNGPQGNRVDVSCDGQFNEFHSIDTNTRFVFTSNSASNRLIGGNHDAIDHYGDANEIADVRYNRSVGAATVNDYGTNLRRGDMFNCGTKMWDSQRTGTISLSDSAPTYACRTRAETLVVTNPGGLTSIVVYRNGLALCNWPIDVPFQLSCGDIAAFAFTGQAPAVLSMAR